MKQKSLFVLVIAAILLAGCANPSIVRIKDEKLRNITPKRVYVARFEGDPNYVEESTDYFVATLESSVSVDVVQGTVLRREGDDIWKGSNLVPRDIAVEKAKQANADLLILGKVTSHERGDMFNGFSTVRVIDVKTGEIVASFHRPSGMLIAFSVHQTVMAAVERTAEDVASMLNQYS